MKRQEAIVRLRVEFLEQNISGELWLTGQTGLLIVVVVDREMGGSHV